MVLLHRRHGSKRRLSQYRSNLMTRGYFTKRVIRRVHYDFHQGSAIVFCCIQWIALILGRPIIKWKGIFLQYTRIWKCSAILICTRYAYIRTVYMYIYCYFDLDLNQILKDTKLYPALWPPSSGSRNFGEGGPRNMKYRPLCVVAIFFWPIFTGQGGGPWPPWPPPPGSATASPLCRKWLQNTKNVSVHGDLIAGLNVDSWSVLLRLNYLIR